MKDVKKRIKEKGNENIPLIYNNCHELYRFICPFCKTAKITTSMIIAVGTRERKSFICDESLPDRQANMIQAIADITANEMT
ncbi:MAG: hypothetical protein K9M75_00680 [Phycisphaerae bacterium]|nr:hypothetical protein [Phycisphaerae bacterium]